MNRRAAATRGLLFLAVAIMMGTPMHAQVSSDNVPADWLQSIGAVPTLIEAPLVVDLLGSVGADSNVYGREFSPVGSAVVDPGVHVGWQQEGWIEREQLALDYEGLGLIYPGHAAISEFNHQLGFHFTLMPTSRLLFRVADSAYYETGLFGMTPAPAATITGPTVTPLTTNPIVAVPVVRTLSDQAQWDMDYTVSPRGALDLFENVGLLHFYGGGSDSSADLFDTYDRKTGLSYNYRLSRSVWIGPTVSVDKLSYAGPSHADVASGLGSVSWTLGANWTLTGFGGAQHVIEDENISTVLFGLNATISSHQTGTHPEMGGSIERHWGRYRADLSGQRTVTDGGGLLTTTENSYEQASLTHSMGSSSWTDWETTVDISNGDSRSLSAGLPDALLRDQQIEILLRRNLTDQLTLRVTEGFTRQRATNLPDFVSDNRNLFLVGVEWRLLGPAGGR